MERQERRMKDVYETPVIEIIEFETEEEKR